MVALPAFKFIKDMLRPPEVGACEVMLCLWKPDNLSCTQLMLFLCKCHFMDFVVSCNSFLIQLDWLVIIMLNNTNSDQLNSIICPNVTYNPILSFNFWIVQMVSLLPTYDGIFWIPVESMCLNPVVGRQGQQGLLCWLNTTRITDLHFMIFIFMRLCIISKCFFLYFCSFSLVYSTSSIVCLR